ncbi:MAG: hypothetical protein PHH83_04010 [Patescibacteria group bacterium]|nr:hypothetical protein [Patescibacteria group bacterium]
MKITKLYFFEELFGAYSDFTPEDHLHHAYKFLCVELSSGEKILIVGSHEFAISDLLRQAIFEKKESPTKESLVWEDLIVERLMPGKAAVSLLKLQMI